MAEERTAHAADLPDWVQEAEQELEREAKNPKAEARPEPREKKEIAIKFGKGLVGEPFAAKSGKQVVEVKIPNVDPKDRTPWASFVISPKMIHDNKFGRGVWMKLPEDGKTWVRKPVCTGADPTSGKKIWEDSVREIPNTELKAMLEAYKTRNQEKSSVRGALQEKREEAAAKPAPAKAAKPKDRGKEEQRL